MSYERFAYAYDRLMEGMPYGEWLSFLRASLRLFDAHPATIADLGCGTGALAIPLALEGYRVTGIDLSADMLAVARQKAERRNALARPDAIRWLEQDLREWQLDEPVDAAISFCDCLNYLLEEDDIRAAFRQTYAGLKPGGLFLFDVHTPQQLLAYAEAQPFFLNEPDVSYIWTSELDGRRVQIEHDLTIFMRDGETDVFRRIEELHVQRAYALDWLEAELVAAGFAEVRLGADFCWQAPTRVTERAFFAAIKG